MQRTAYRNMDNVPLVDIIDRTLLYLVKIPIRYLLLVLNHVASIIVLIYQQNTTRDKKKPVISDWFVVEHNGMHPNTRIQ